MTILVGCSGWSYDDWVGKFYPLELAKRKGDLFSYYAQFFNTVEINSTFYRPPGELQVQSWIKKARDLKGFEYSVKVPQLVTHKALVEGDQIIYLIRSLSSSSCLCRFSIILVISKRVCNSEMFFSTFPFIIMLN